MEQKFVVRSLAQGSEVYYQKESAGEIYSVSEPLEAEVFAELKEASSVCDYLNEVTQEQFEVCLLVVKCRAVKITELEDEVFCLQSKLSEAKEELDELKYNTEK
jgi:hypothetical protein